MSLSKNTQNPLTQALDLPTRNKWTHHAIAEYLHCSRATVAIYATTICPVSARARRPATKSSTQHFAIFLGF